MKKSNNWVYLVGFFLMCIILVLMILVLSTFAAQDPEDDNWCVTCKQFWLDDDYCFDCDHCINDCTCCSTVGHSYGSWYVVKTATCTESGQIRHDCNNCDYYELTTTLAKGHDYVDCVCTRCNDVSHSWSDADIPATCTTDGSHRQICDNCGAEELGDSIPALGHTFVSGSCSVCGASDPNYDPCANGHNYVDCVCTRCNDVSHSWSDADIPATCTASGTHRQICDNCGAEELGESIPALGHDFVNAVCSRCGVSDADHVHSWGEWTVLTERSCTVGYSAVCRCTVCGEIQAEELPPFGHNWTNETVIQAGGCLEDRIVRYTCSRCHITEDRTTKAPGHKLVTTRIEPTCEKDGCITDSCSVCNIVILSTSVPALSHVYVEISREEVTANLVIIKEQCSNCKEIKERILANEAGQGEIISNWAVVLVDGVFDGVLDSYDILSNGISVGGVSLSNVVTSFFMVCLLIIIVAIICGLVL